MTESSHARRSHRPTARTRRGIVPTMPRQRWRNEVLDELRALRGEIGGMRGEMSGMRGEMSGMRGEMSGMRGEIGGMRGELTAEFRQNRAVVQDVRAAIRDMKGSVDRNTDVTDRTAEMLSGLVAQVHADRTAIEDLSGEIRAHREGLLALIDEFRRNGGGPGSA